jgi:hypothetical protein
MFSACADSIQTVLKLLALGMSCKLNLLLNHSFVIVAAGTRIIAIWLRHVVEVLCLGQVLRLGQQVLADVARVTVDELNGVRNGCATMPRNNWGDAGWKRQQNSVRRRPLLLDSLALLGRSGLGRAVKSTSLLEKILFL